MNAKDVLRSSVAGLASLLTVALPNWAEARDTEPRSRSIPKELVVSRPAPTPADAVAKALKNLDTPEYRGYHTNQFSPTTKTYLPEDHYRTCPDAIDFLIKTKAAVDQELLRLAESDKKLRVRYRAVRILAARKNVAVVPLLDRMCASSDDKERYLGWKTYADAIREKKLPAPKDVSEHIRLYASERDREVRECIEWFFGTAKARAAVKLLLKTLDRNSDACPAIWTLGEIGDKEAVPKIIAAFAEATNKHYHLQALGKLATPEAVDFIVANLGRYGAAEALAATRSEKALPALRKHLETLRQGKGPDNAIDLAATRIAIIRLSRKDPREPLVELAENKKEEHHVRWDAFRALQEHDSTPYHRRILKVYTSDTDVDIKRFCIWLLETSSLEGITEAMIDHALTVGESKTIGDFATLDSLLKALNKRLGTSFRDMKSMQSHLRSLQRKTKDEQ